MQLHGESIKDITGDFVSARSSPILESGGSNDGLPEEFQYSSSILAGFKDIAKVKGTIWP